MSIEELIEEKFKQIEKLIHQIRKIINKNENKNNTNVSADDQVILDMLEESNTE